VPSNIFVMRPAQPTESLVLFFFHALGMEIQRYRNVCRALTVYEPVAGLKASNIHSVCKQHMITVHARLLAGSQYASGRSCDRPTRSKISVVFLGSRANAELVPKFHLALCASHEALQMFE
jgi:hypothetical protein